MSSDDDVLVLPGFSGESEITALLSVFRGAVTANTEGVFPGVRTRPTRTEVFSRNIAQVCQSADLAVVDAVRSRMITTMREHFAAPTECAETTVLAEMRVGDSHPLHADAERQMSPGEWGLNHTPYRTRVGLLYLNTCGVDFQGGQLRLPELNRAIAPTAGMLVAFPSGRRHVHEVARVDAGERLTFTVWLTADPSRVEPWAM